MLGQRLIGELGKSILAPYEGVLPTLIGFDLSQDERGKGVLLFGRKLRRFGERLFEQLSHLETLYFLQPARCFRTASVKPYLPLQLLEVHINGIDLPRREL
jgi:hypothetical protein